MNAPDGFVVRVGVGVVGLDGFDAHIMGWFYIKEVNTIELELIIRCIILSLEMSLAVLLLDGGLPSFEPKEIRIHDVCLNIRMFKITKYNQHTKSKIKSYKNY